MKWFKTPYKELTDEQLMQKLASGDQKAFDDLYERYANAILNYFYRMLWKDREKSEDFVHDLFSKIIQNPGSFDTSRTFKTWIYSVANNMCKNEYKKQAVRSGTISGLEDYMAITDGEENAMTKAHFTLFGEAFQEQLAKLDNKHREAFIYRHIEGLSIKEISALLATSEGTIKSRIFYATKQLAEALQQYQPKKSSNHG